MPIIDKANDKDLRSLVYKYDKVIVKFVDEQCPICKVLAPVYSSMAADAAHEDILFLRMNAAENPVSSKEVRLTGTPFIATYYKGVLQDCGLVSTPLELQDMLHDLLRT